jgi:hypothetical protein
MDLAGHSQQLQAMVIRACLEQINQHESGVLTVFPEAWEFAPRGRVTPASDEAVAMARKGAVLGNFLLCDSQDIAGVDTVVRQAASVWILGVQRELNELKRTLAMIPAGIRKAQKPRRHVAEARPVHRLLGTTRSGRTCSRRGWSAGDRDRSAGLRGRRRRVPPSWPSTPLGNVKADRNDPRRPRPRPFAHRQRRRPRRSTWRTTKCRRKTSTDWSDTC